MKVTNCIHPKCHDTKRGCRCPNPWIEFLSKTASERKKLKLEPLSIRKLASQYRKLKATGAFEGRSMDVCNSNTSLLCKWNAARKSGKVCPSSETSLTKFSSPPPSILPHLPLDNRNEFGPDFFDESITETSLFRLWSPRIKNLLPNFRFSGIVDGSSKHMIFMLMQEKTTSAYLLVRFTRDTGNSGTPLAKSVAAQLYFEQKLGKLVPRVHFVYDLISSDDSITVIGTDVAQGTLDKLMAPARRKQFDMLSVASALKKLLSQLREAKVVHGDMGLNNITYRLSSDKRRVEYAGLIDFECSYIGRPSFNPDEVEILEILTNRKMLKSLHESGYQFPKWFRDIATDKDLSSKLQKFSSSLIKGCKNGFEEIPIPLIQVG